MNNEKYLGESSLQDKPKKKINFTLREGSVTTEKLAEGSITNEKIAENTITTDKVKDNTLGIEKFDKQLQEVISAALGMPEDLIKTIQNVDTAIDEVKATIEENNTSLQEQITANDKTLTYLNKKHTEDITAVQEAIKETDATMKGIVATGGGASVGTAVTYDNTNSSLAALNMQSAVDELANSVVYITEDEYEALADSDSLNPRIQYNIIEE